MTVFLMRWMSLVAALSIGFAYFLRWFLTELAGYGKFPSSHVSFAGRGVLCGPSAAAAATTSTTRASAKRGTRHRHHEVSRWRLRTPRECTKCLPQGPSSWRLTHEGAHQRLMGARLRI